MVNRKGMVLRQESRGITKNIMNNWIYILHLISLNVRIIGYLLHQIMIETGSSKTNAKIKKYRKGCHQSQKP